MIFTSAGPSDSMICYALIGASIARQVSIIVIPNPPSRRQIIAPCGKCCKMCICHVCRSMSLLDKLKLDLHPREGEIDPTAQICRFMLRRRLNSHPWEATTNIHGEDAKKLSVWSWALVMGSFLGSETLWSSDLVSVNTELGSRTSGI